VAHAISQRVRKRIEEVFGWITCPHCAFMSNRFDGAPHILDRPSVYENLECPSFLSEPVERRGPGERPHESAPIKHWNSTTYRVSRHLAITEALGFETVGGLMGKPVDAGPYGYVALRIILPEARAAMH